MPQLIPRQSVPDLEVPTVDGGLWHMAGQKPETFTLVVFYRGLHCPICKPYLRDLQGRLDEVTERGVSVIAISCDGEARAHKSKEEWGLKRLVIGYDLSIDMAREWGLFISAAIGDHEPPLFCEPGVFLVRPDRTLYASAVNSMPFARPSFAEIEQALDFIIPKQYPARGEVV